VWSGNEKKSSSRPSANGHRVGFVALSDIDQGVDRTASSERERS
jgi:hypothetical protein